jgi:hypothetical protein
VSNAFIASKNGKELLPQNLFNEKDIFHSTEYQ